MRVGILTFHRAQNYGAVLQCFALQETLKKIGYNTLVIDYRQSYIENVYKIFSLRRFFELIIHPNGLILYLLKIQKRKRRTKLFSAFRNKYIKITEKCSKQVPQIFDLYIVGSDQLWGTKNCTNGIDNFYFGRFGHPKKSRVIGYAISSNMKSLLSIPQKELVELTKNFTYLSFREEAIKHYIENITGIIYRQDIDPTFLADVVTWEQILNKKWERKQYVLVYEIPGRGRRGVLKSKATQLAKQLNCSVIDASTMEYSPEDFVSLFKYATYVVTSSFHGTAFSLIFERSAYIVKWNDGHDLRYENLLKKIGADSMLVDPDFNPEYKLIDYSEIRKKIEQLRLYSLAYLKSFLIQEKA